MRPCRPCESGGVTSFNFTRVRAGKPNGGSKTLIHGLGAVLLAARIIHPFGIDAANMRKVPRLIGAFASIGVILAAAVTLLWQYVR